MELFGATLRKVCIVMNISTISYWFYDAINSMKKNKKNIIISIGTMITTMVIIAITFAVIKNASYIIEQRRGMESRILACAVEGATEEQIANIKSQLDSMEEVKDYTFQSSADGLKYALEKDPILVEGLPEEMNAKGLRSVFGGKISVNTVNRMFHNRRYIGEFKYRDIVVPDGIPAIVSIELFERVQRRMEATRKAPAKYKAEEEYLLTTKLYCGKCNCFMVGESGTSKTANIYRYYKCVSVKNHKGCDKKSVRKDWIEDLVIKQIESVLFNDRIIDKLADDIMTLQGKENTVLPLLRKKQEKVQRSIDNIIKAIEEGICTPSTKERLEALENEKNVDFSSINIEKYTEFKSSLYDSSVGGSTYSLTIKIAASDKIIQMEIERLKTFKDHPFKVENDDEMKLL